MTSKGVRGSSETVSAIYKEIRKFLSPHASLPRSPYHVAPYVVVLVLPFHFYGNATSWKSAVGVQQPAAGY